MIRMCGSCGLIGAQKNRLRRLRAGPHRLVALITREAVDELGLVPGVRAVGVVKATNVIVELPRA